MAKGGTHGPKPRKQRMGKPHGSPMWKDPATVGPSGCGLIVVGIVGIVGGVVAVATAGVTLLG